MHFPRLTILFFLLTLSVSIHSQVGINNTGNNPDNSAMLDIISTDKGMLIPRMASSDRTMISSPADGLMVYDTTTTSFWYYDNNKWNEIGKSFDQLKPSDLIGEAADPDFSCFADIGTVALIGNPLDIAVVGDYAYIIPFSGNELQVADVSDPFNPTVVGNLTLTSTLNSLDAVGNFVYIIENATNALRIIDASDPTNPNQVGSIGLGSGLNGIEVDGNYAYVISASQNRIRVVDISNPASLSIVDNLTGGSPADIDIFGNYAYTVGVSSEILRVVDISDPTNLQLEGSLSMPSRPVNISASGDYVYITNVSNNELEIIDVSNASTPIAVSTIALGPDPDNLKAVGSYAFVLDYDIGELTIVDATNPATPSIVNGISTGPDPYAIDVKNGYAYVIDETDGDLRVIQLICPTTAFAYNPLSNSFEVLPEFPGDDLGNHTATQNLNIGSNWLTGDGDDEGIALDNSGNVGIGTMSPNSKLQINGSLATPYVDTGSTTGTFTVDNTHHTIRVFNDISTLALPNPTTMPGRIYTLIGSNGMSAKTITVSGGAIIYDDVTNTTVNTLNGNTRLRIQSDGGIWIVIGN